MYPFRAPADYDYPHRIYNQHFGVGLTDEDLPQMFPVVPPMWGFVHQRRPGAVPRSESGVSEVKCDPNQFQVKLDTHQFSPEELTVKAVDNFVVVEGTHEEKPDEHGFITRSFVRKYRLPDNIDPDTFDDKVVCSLSSDGVLSITVPRPPAIKTDSKEKILTITQTGQIHAKK